MGNKFTLNFMCFENRKVIVTFYPINFRKLRKIEKLTKKI